VRTGSGSFGAFRSGSFGTGSNFGAGVSRSFSASYGTGYHPYYSTRTPLFGAGTFNPYGVSYAPLPRSIASTSGLPWTYGFGAASPQAFLLYARGAGMTNPYATGFNQAVINYSPYGRFERHLEREAIRDELAAAYALSNPYAYGYGDPYGLGGYPYAFPAYGTGTAYSNPYAAAPPTNVANPPVNPNAGQAKLPVLAAFGIPSEFGEITWPSAFRLLPPDQRAEVKTLEAQLKVAANQAVNGNPSPIVLRQTKTSIDGLRAWFSDHQSNIAESQYQDADRFLRRLTDALHRMEP